MAEALLSRGIMPDVVLGTSIGAMNGAVVAAHPTAEGVSALHSLWAAAYLGFPVGIGVEPGPDPREAEGRTSRLVGAQGSAGRMPARRHLRTAGGPVPVRRGRDRDRSRTVVRLGPSRRRDPRLVGHPRALPPGRDRRDGLLRRWSRQLGSGGPGHRAGMPHHLRSSGREGRAAPAPADASARAGARRIRDLPGGPASRQPWPTFPTTSTSTSYRAATASTSTMLVSCAGGI